MTGLAALPPGKGPLQNEFTDLCRIELTRMNESWVRPYYDLLTIGSGQTFEEWPTTVKTSCAAVLNRAAKQCKVPLDWRAHARHWVGRCGDTLYFRTSVIW
jgi:hypothetical protein